MGLNRREFLKFSSAAIGGLLISTTGYLKLNDESQVLSVERIQLPIRNLHPGMEGFRIAQLTDIHLKPLTQIDLVERAVTITNALSPDLIVLTGDYVWTDLDAIYELCPVLANLNARHGVFSIIGNHDIWLDKNKVISAFKDVGLPILENQGLTISEGGGKLYLAGLDDGWSGQPDLNAAMQYSPADVPVVLLVHEPDLADKFSLDSRISLQLSGHTHGGQIRLPSVGALILPYLGKKYDFGLYSINDMWLYTNRGIGVISEPIRFNCPPEITEFTLVRA